MPFTNGLTAAGGATIEMSAFPPHLATPMRTSLLTSKVSQRLGVAFALALAWYGTVYLLMRATKMEAGVGSTLLTFPHPIVVSIVDRLGEASMPMGGWLFSGHSMERAGWIGLAVYLAFWWVVFFYLLSRLANRGADRRVHG